MPKSSLFMCSFLVFMFIIIYHLHTMKIFEISLKIPAPRQLTELEKLFKLRNNLSVITSDKALLARSIQAGKSDGFRHVLMKALRGENVSMLVIGGSHSAGGKLGLDENSRDGLYYKVFQNWWNETFGRFTKSFLNVTALTIGDTSSYFFAFCYRTFIPEGTSFDIVLIEMSANDKGFASAKPLEQLTRQALIYPSAPVVFYINVVHDFGINPYTKTVENPSCVTLEDFGQAELARHYDITSFNLREIICRKEKGRWKVVYSSMAGSDGKHIGVKAHAQIAYMMTEYVKNIYQKIAYNVTRILPFSITRVRGKRKSFTLPSLFFIKRETEALKEPLCWTGKTPNVFEKLHRSNLKFEIREKAGFSPCFQMYKQKWNVKRVGAELRTDSKGGWCAWRSSSILKLKIYVPRIVGDNSFRTRSVTILTIHKEGRAAIWLDNNKNRTVKTKATKLRKNQVDTIGRGLEPGYHTITVKALSNALFCVAGVFVGAPDYHLV
ncbi:uncharacterized protein LOC111328688 [Stylophora pistillata]|uniref:uncharacterized protein LOC111328688 n=1 Tax=Stylophora pistillata TaxID=50429 RepID=UPI000C042591|nr:uncharacterized protein LOC111328688 [Stylophora pistillata]